MFAMDRSVLENHMKLRLIIMLDSGSTFAVDGTYFRCVLNTAPKLGEHLDL